MPLSHEVERNLDDVQAFLAAQQRCGMAAPLLASIMSGQKQSLLASVQMIDDMTPASANSLISLVEAGPWDDDSKKALVLAIADKVQHAHIRANASTCTQVCTDFSLYPTRSEWDIMKDATVSRTRKVQIIVNRLQLIGLHRPSEQTRKHVASLIGMFDHASEGKEICDDIRFWLRRLKVVSSGNPLRVFPFQPQDLSEAVFAQAYKDEGPAPPGYVDTSRSSAVADRMWLRTSHGKASPNSKSTQLATNTASQPSPALPGGDGTWLMRTLFAALGANGLSSALSISGSSESSGPSTSNSLVAPTQLKITDKELDGTTPGLPPGSTLGAPVFGSKVVDRGNDDVDAFKAMEKELADALVAKTKAKKSRATEAKPKGKAKPTAKPKAKKAKAKAQATAKTKPQAKAKAKCKSTRKTATKRTAKSTVIHYKGGRIYTSKLIGGYRVMFPGEKRLDKKFRWSHYPSKPATLEHIKRQINKALRAR